MQKNFIIILVFCLSIDEISSVCLEYDLIRPCTCEDSSQKDTFSIECSGAQINLDELFENWTKSLNKDQKYFKRFQLSNTGITELKANQFRDITIGEIEIEDNHELKTIDQDAFHGNEQQLTSVTLKSNAMLTFPNNSIFDILSKLTNLEDVTIIDSNVETIPSNAFNSYQLSLGRLYFGGDSFKTIEDNAFSSLINLESLVMFNTLIESIPENGLHFNENTQKRLNIYYSDPNLNNTGFSVNTLLNINRSPVEIRIVSSWKFLDEAIFKPFLKVNKKNEILIYSGLDCDDSRNFWLINDQDLLPQIKLCIWIDGHVYVNLSCSNEKKSNDSQNFPSCK